MSEENYSVFIVEDKLSSRELLIEFLLLREELRLEGMAKSGEEALEKLHKKEYDILFLDIGLPEMSGIEVLENLSYKPHVIFTTAYNKFAIRAFELGAVDYLQKPFTVDRFNQAVDKVLSNIKNQKPSLDISQSIGLSFRENNKHYIIAYNDIIYCSSHARHTIIHTDERDFETSKLLKELVKKLPEEMFLRIHKQYCVNLTYVSNVEYTLGGLYNITLKDEDNTILPVGKKYSPEFKKKLKI